MFVARHYTRKRHTAKTAARIDAHGPFTAGRERRRGLKREIIKTAPCQTRQNAVKRASMTPMQPYKGPRYCRGGKLKEQGASIPAAARTARTAPQQEYNRKCLMCQACTRHKRNCACHGTDRRSPEALRPPTDGRCIWNSAQRRSKQYRRKRPATYNRTRKPDTREHYAAPPDPGQAARKCTT